MVKRHREMRLRLLERIRRLKLRFPGRRAKNRLPLLSYEQIDEAAREELINEAIEGQLADIEALDAALRSLN